MPAAGHCWRGCGRALISVFRGVLLVVAGFSFRRGVLLVVAGFSFRRGDWALGYHSMGFRHFPDKS